MNLFATTTFSEQIEMSLSGYVGKATVDSLPREVKERWALSARLMENAMRAPNSQGIRESYRAEPLGMPTHLTWKLGVPSASVDTLAMQYSPPSANGPSLGPGPAGLDRWDQNRLQE